MCRGRGRSRWGSAAKAGHLPAAAANRSAGPAALQGGATGGGLSVSCPMGSDQALLLVRLLPSVMPPSTVFSLPLSLPCLSNALSPSLVIRPSHSEPAETSTPFLRVGAGQRSTHPTATFRHSTTNNGGQEAALQHCPSPSPPTSLMASRMRALSHRVETGHPISAVWPPTNATCAEYIQDLGMGNG